MDDGDLGVDDLAPHVELDGADSYSMIPWAAQGILAGLRKKAAADRFGETVTYCYDTSLLTSGLYLDVQLGLLGAFIV